MSKLKLQVGLAQPMSFSQHTGGVEAVLKSIRPENQCAAYFVLMITSDL